MKPLPPDAVSRFGSRRFFGAGNRGHLRAFTALELLLSLGLTLIVSLLLWGGTAQSLENARKAECLANMRQIGAAAFSYAVEHHQRLPMPKDWAATDSDGGRQALWFWRLAPYLLPGEPLGAPTATSGPIAGVLRCPKGEAYKRYGRGTARKGGWGAVDYGVRSGNGKSLYLYSAEIDHWVWLVEAETYSGNLIGEAANHINALIPQRARQRHNGLHLLYGSGRITFCPQPTTDRLLDLLKHESVNQ